MGVRIARVSQVLLICLRAAVLLLAISSVFDTTQAAYVYTFSGQVPSNTDFVIDAHPQIGAGETWVATVEIDETVPGTDWGNSNWRGYYGAVRKGSLVFSGGYVAPLNFYGFTIAVFDDVGEDSPIDRVELWNNDQSFRIVASSDRNPLSSDNLPLPGTTVVPGPSDNTRNIWHFSYDDSLGFFKYVGQFGTNVYFSAAVPEPASLTLASILGGSLVLARRRRC